MSATKIPAEIVNCEPCNGYFRKRNVSVLALAVVEVAEHQGVPTSVITRRFATGLHARHLAGKSIEVTVAPPKPNRIVPGRFSSLMRLSDEGATA